MSLLALLRSSHTLILALGIASVVLFYLSSGQYDEIAYLAAGLFALCVLAVIGRYVFHGPEQDRLQPALTYSSQHLQILNVEP
jgi:hypothetical protein